MTKRQFVDAPDEKRCHAIVKLWDKTTAQCGRSATVGDLCLQHYRMDAAGKPLNRVAAASITEG